jgi:hypothetical protein
MRANPSGRVPKDLAEFDRAVLLDDFELKLPQPYGTTGAMTSLMLAKRGLSSSG